LKLTGTKTGDIQTGITSQSIVVRPATVMARGTVNDDGRITAVENLPPDAPSPALYSWEATSDGQTVNLVVLANQVVDTWTAWLHHPQQNLL
jgi:hypothetical protein